jgi:hypothetical protein
MASFAGFLAFSSNCSLVSFSSAIPASAPIRYRINGIRACAIVGVVACQLAFHLVAEKPFGYNSQRLGGDDVGPKGLALGLGSLAGRAAERLW